MSTPNQEALNLSATMLLQQQLAAGTSAPTPLGLKSFAGPSLGSSLSIEAILKNQQDHLKIAQLLKQNREVDDYMASSAGASTASPLLQRQMLLGGVGAGSLVSSGPSMGTIKKTLDEALTILQSGDTVGSERPSLLGMSSRGQMSSLLGGNNVSTLPQSTDTVTTNPNFVSKSLPNTTPDSEEAESNKDEEQTYKVDTDKEGDAQNDEEEDDEKYYSDSNSDKIKDGQDARNSNETFPLKLYRMLIEAEKNGQAEIVSFFPHNRAFAIHKPRDFVTEIMPKYFTTGRMSSFQRQLNLYGFKRITEGRDKGGYYHEHFLKGRRTLCKKIKRKRTSVKAPPNFFNNPTSLDARQIFGRSAAAVAGDTASSLLDLSRHGFLSQAAAAANSSSVDASSLLELSRHGLLGQAAGANDILSGLVGSHVNNQPTVGQLQQELMLHQVRQQQLQQELLLRGSMKL